MLVVLGRPRWSTNISISLSLYQTSTCAHCHQEPLLELEHKSASHAPATAATTTTTRIRPIVKHAMTFPCIPLPFLASPLPRALLIVAPPSFLFLLLLSPPGPPVDQGTLPSPQGSLECMSIHSTTRRHPYIRAFNNAVLHRTLGRTGAVSVGQTDWQSSQAQPSRSGSDDNATTVMVAIDHAFGHSASKQAKEKRHSDTRTNDSITHD